MRGLLEVALAAINPRMRNRGRSPRQDEQVHHASGTGRFYPARKVESNYPGRAYLQLPRAPVHINSGPMERFNTVDE